MYQITPLEFSLGSLIIINKTMYRIVDICWASRALVLKKEESKKSRRRKHRAAKLEKLFLTETAAHPLEKQ